MWGLEADPLFQRYVELLTERDTEALNDIEIRIKLGHGLLNLGELHAIIGDGSEALVVFRQCVEVRRILLQSDRNNPDRLVELAWAEVRLAEFGDTPGIRWRRIDALFTKADKFSPLGDFEEELLTVTRIALSGLQQ